MHGSAATCRAVALMLLVTAAPYALAEEAGGVVAAPTDTGTTPGLAGFHPVSDVTAHAAAVEDVKDLADAGNDYGAASDVYENGKNSPGKTLKKMSTKFANSETMQKEPLAVVLNAFWERFDYADAMISAALAGTDAGRLGNYGSATLAKTDDARKQIIKKGAAYSSLWLYALHEMEAALAKYETGSYDPAKGAPHLLDEVWAFYAGNSETGDGSGVGPYTGGEKFGPYFGTYGYELGTGGRSRVSLEVLYHLTAMQRYLQTPGNKEALRDAARCVRAQFKVPIIQGCLKYAHQASSTDLTKDEKVAKIKAEAWAFCVGALAFLNEADSEAAQAVEKQVTLNDAARPDWKVVKQAFSTKNLNKMGVSCQDVGVLGGGGIHSAKYVGEAQPYESNDEQMSWCKDDAKLMQSNSHADSGLCKFTRMPTCSSAVVCSAASALQASSALFWSAVVALCSLMATGRA